MTQKIQTGPENAQKFHEWIRDRGGILQWKSCDLSDLGWGCFTPARAKDEDGGGPYPKPHWKADSNPTLITSEENVLIVVPKEVKRFHVAIRLGSQGLSYKLTDGSSRKLRQALDRVNDRRADKDAWYEFDYGTQEAVIYVPGETATLTEWLARSESVGTCAEMPRTSEI